MYKLIHLPMQLTELRKGWTAIHAAKLAEEEEKRKYATHSQMVFLYDTQLSVEKHEEKS